MRINVNVSRSGYTRIGDLVGSLEPAIRKAMQDAVDEALRDSFVGRASSRPAMTIIDDPILSDWIDRARAAGMSEDEIEQAHETAKRCDAPLTIDGSAREVES